MAIGCYRLSFDEQRQRHDEAARDARLQRLAITRRRSLDFTASQSRRYKEYLDVEKAKAGHAMHKRWESLCDNRLHALHQRHEKELRQVGNAQREAEIASASETALRHEQRHQEKISNGKRRQRYNKAMRTVRETDTRKQQRLTHLVDLRKLQTIQSRRNASAYARQRRSPQKKDTAPCTVSNKRGKTPIEFRTSRVHRELGAENAMDLAKSQTERVAAKKESEKQRKELSEIKARDRGHVALLRERAIAQREMHLYQNEKKRKAEIKAKQSEKTQGRARAIQNLQNNPNPCRRPEPCLLPVAPVQEQGMREYIVDQSVQRLSQETARKPVKIDMAVQVDLDEWTDMDQKHPVAACLTQTAEQPGIVDQWTSVEPRRLPKSIKTQTQSPKRSPRGRGSKTHSKRSPIDKNKLCKAHPLKRKTFRDKSRIPKCPPKTQTRIPCGSKPRIQTPLQRSLPPVHHTPKNLYPQPPEDDALSETLSMDTDQLLNTYLQHGNTSLSTPTSSTIDSMDLEDNISAMLKQTDSERDRSINGEEDVTSFSLSSPSLSTKDTSPVSTEMSSLSSLSAMTDTTFPFSERSLLSSPSLSTADTELLLTKLDHISHDSLSLLSNFSHYLSSDMVLDTICEDPEESTVACDYSDH